MSKPTSMAITAHNPYEAITVFVRILLDTGAPPDEIVAGLGAVMVRTLTETTIPASREAGGELLVSCLRTHLAAIQAEHVGGLQ